MHTPNDQIAKILKDIIEAFSDCTGPALYRYKIAKDEWDTTFEEIEKRLLSLDPRDLRIDDLDCYNSDILNYATHDGLKWLIPGITRAIFEETRDAYAEELLHELRRRTAATESPMELTNDQCTALYQFFASAAYIDRPDWEKPAFPVTSYEWLVPHSS